MQHDRHADSRSHIGGADGQIAELLVEGEGEGLTQQIVNVIDLLPGSVELQSAPQDLNTKVILLVDHQRTGLAGRDAHAATPRRGGVLTTDQMTFDEHLAINLLGLLHIDQQGIGAGHSVRHLVG